jgi:hypothetical protein
MGRVDLGIGTLHTDSESGIGGATGPRKDEAT